MARCQVPKPDYPLIALQRRREGTVLIRITVDTSGRVAEAKVVRPVDLLSEAALKAARAARCTAATRGDQPVEEWVEVPVQFLLPK